MLGETLIRSSYLAFGSGGQQVNHLTPTPQKKYAWKQHIVWCLAYGSGGLIQQQARVIRL